MWAEPPYISGVCGWLQRKPLSSEQRARELVPHRRGAVGRGGTPRTYAQLSQAGRVAIPCGAVNDTVAEEKEGGGAAGARG